MDNNRETIFNYWFGCWLIVYIKVHLRINISIVRLDSNIVIPGAVENPSPVAWYSVRIAFSVVGSFAFTRVMSDKRKKKGKKRLPYFPHPQR